MHKLLLTAYLISLSIGLISCKETKQEETFFSENSLFDYLYPNDTSTKSVVVLNTPLAIQKKLESTNDKHYGIDISHYQGDLMEMLKAKKDSIKFVICKATQGAHYTDPMFRSNWNEIQNKGFVRGAYHFYNSSDDPIAQAEHFSSMIADIKDYDIAPILDIEQGGMNKEVSSSKMERDILIFLQHVEKLTKRKPIIYSDYAFLQENLTNPIFTTYKLWLAEYSGKKKPLVPTIWKNKGFAIWQRSDSYKAYATQIDFDLVEGSLKNIIK